jgi:ribonuclease BN (tRNA processing enzyme)
MYSGDGAVTEGTRALARGVSVLVHECFFSQRPRERKHGDLDSCVELAVQAGVESLALLHFAAEAKQTIRERALELASSTPDLQVVLPKPGDTLALALP